MCVDTNMVEKLLGCRLYVDFTRDLFYPECKAFWEDDNQALIENTTSISKFPCPTTLNFSGRTTTLKRPFDHVFRQGLK